MIKDMFLGKIDYAIIELDKTATKDDINFFKEMYPNSIVLKENSHFLNMIYSKLNLNTKIKELKDNIDQLSKPTILKTLKSINIHEKYNYSNKDTAFCDKKYISFSDKTDYGIGA